MQTLGVAIALGAALVISALAFGPQPQTSERGLFPVWPGGVMYMERDAALKSPS